MTKHNLRFWFGTKCGSVASHPDTTLVHFCKGVQNTCRLSHKSIWAHIPNSTWVMLIKSKYNKQYREDEFRVYKAKRKFIGWHLLNTSQVYAKSYRKPHAPLNLLADRAQISKPRYKCWWDGIEIWPASLLPWPRCTRWREVRNGSWRSQLLHGLSSFSLHTHILLKILLIELEIQKSIQVLRAQLDEFTQSQPTHAAITQIQN